MDCLVNLFVVAYGYCQFKLFCLAKQIMLVVAVNLKYFCLAKQIIENGYQI